MSAERYREQTPDGPIIHCGPCDGNDYTLCGYALEGEASSNEDGDAEPELVLRGKINCEKCITIIRFAKTIPAKWLKP
jgi:hypothetical protein